MKKISLILGLFLFPQLAFGALTDDLVSWWTMEETSGTRLDSHGSNDLTDNNTVLYGTGIIGNGADFESANTEYLSKSSPSGVPLNDLPRAFSAWVKLESLPATDSFRQIIGYGTHAENQKQEFVVANLSSVYTLRSDYYGGGQGSTPFSPSTATWYHFVMSYDGTTITFYKDGSALGTASGHDYANTASLLHIGAFLNGTEQLMDGIVDEVAIWSRDLSSDEVTELYNGGAGVTYDDILEPPPVELTATTTIAYTDWLFVNSIIIGCLGFLALGFILNPIKT